MTDHIVSLPQSVSPDLRAAIATLALAGSFASPSHQSAASLESDLLTRFSATASLDTTSVIAWLESSGMSYQDLGGLVAQFPANVSPLHTALQQQIDAQGVVLLQVARVEQLFEATTNSQLHPGQTGTHWLVRSGYSDDSDYGLYYDVSAVGQPQPVHILWKSVLDAGIMAAIALNAPVPPKPPVDMVAVANDLHIVEQAMLAVTQALDSVKAALEIA